MSGIIGIATGAAAEPGRHRVLIPTGDAKIDTIVEGDGPLVVMLPSRGQGLRGL